jgi:hypothetical protein
MNRRPATPSKHRQFPRRAGTKVRNGRVRQDSRAVPTGALGYVIDRESPGRGFRHVATKRDLQRFIDLIPDWDRLSHRIERILLAGSGPDDGQYIFYHREKTSAIFLHAWPEDLWMDLPVDYFDEHEEILQTFGVSHERVPARESVACRFTERQARAFLLLHIFLHELGHHSDRLDQKQRGPARGEDYAERFALTRFREMLPDYIRAFGDPRLAR